MIDFNLSFMLLCLTTVSTVSFLGLVAAQNSTEESYLGQSDLVTSLPGYTGNYSECGHYSGYLEADNRTFLHYWFFQSRTGNWKSDPVVVYMAGGPGGSSVGEALSSSRFAPMFLDTNNSIVFNRNYSWVEKANILYFDTPAGVGFSYQLEPQDKDIKDATIADYNYAAIKNFFFKFPLLQNNTFYLSGSSYVTIYISLLGRLLVENKFLPNFNGVLYLSSAFNGTERNSATIAHGLQLGLFDETHLAHFVESCCPATFCSARKCFFQEGCIYPYNNSPCCYAYHILLSHCNVDHYNKFGIGEEEIANITEEVTTDGIDESTRKELWFQNDSVKNSLNINEFSYFEWLDMNETIIDSKFKDNSVSKDVKILLNNGIRVMICYGEADLLTSYINGIWLLDYLGDQLELQSHAPWILNNEMAGFKRRLVYTNNTIATSVKLVVVRRAGHNVPKDQPARLWQIFNDFLEDN